MTDSSKDLKKKKQNQERSGCVGKAVNQGGWRVQWAVWMALVPRDLQPHSTDLTLDLSGMAEDCYCESLLPPFHSAVLPTFPSGLDQWITYLHDVWFDGLVFPSSCNQLNSEPHRHWIRCEWGRSSKWTDKEPLAALHGWLRLHIKWEEQILPFFFFF